MIMAIWCVNWFGVRAEPVGTIKWQESSLRGNSIPRVSLEAPSSQSWKPSPEHLVTRWLAN
jgi:hypothetical protein